MMLNDNTEVYVCTRGGHGLPFGYAELLLICIPFEGTREVMMSRTSLGEIGARIQAGTIDPKDILISTEKDSISRYFEKEFLHNKAVEALDKMDAYQLHSVISSVEYDGYTRIPWQSFN